MNSEIKVSGSLEFNLQCTELGPTLKIKGLIESLITSTFLEIKKYLSDGNIDFQNLSSKYGKCAWINNNKNELKILVSLKNEVKDLFDEHDYDSKLRHKINHLIQSREDFIQLKKSSEFTWSNRINLIGIGLTALTYYAGYHHRHIHVDFFYGSVVLETAFAVSALSYRCFSKSWQGGKISAKATELAKQAWELTEQSSTKKRIGSPVKSANPNRGTYV